MVTNHDYRQFTILYVDDEAQALKYFRKALEKDFEILTAENVEEARKILAEQADRIGILVCDQRMPGERGTDLLASARTDYPGIIRVLTTAYSDLDSAIEGVNSGAIYKYIVKPWDVRDLRGVLLRAMDFFIVQRQRDSLLREKLSVLQRMMVSDRIRSLAVLAAGLSHHIRNSMSALKTFLDLMPEKLEAEVSQGTLRDPSYWQDVWQSAQVESKRVLKLVENVSSIVVKPNEKFESFVAPADLVKSAIERANTGECKIEFDPDGDLAELKVNRELSDRMLDILLRKAVALNEDRGTIQLKLEGPQAVWGTPGVKLTISGDGEAWKQLGSETLFTALTPSSSDVKDGGLEVLSAFFVANHHGGDIGLIAKGAQPRIELTLPNDPLAAERPPTNPNFLDDVFDMFELQQLNSQTSPQ
ncbi:MAG: response regulator [Planctomycetes bacterium]|nr:response regulator [Planctomycetota bacterium]MCA8935801.1 response regulator [Planctomycetota bacterium]